MKRIKVAIVDDHKMISKAIEDMISIHPSYEVLFNCANGEEFIEALAKANDFPELVIMDVNMPFKNGIETTEFLKENYPQMKVIALTMEDQENTIIKMMRAGAKGYLLKDMTPEILFEALDTVYRYGSFETDFLSQKILKITEYENKIQEMVDRLSENERSFIKLACTELTYKEIADVMNLSPKTVDYYRNNVFLKLEVKSRVGIVLFAIKNKLI